jgi:uncharacterized membrane protein YphA (DoxX/SURF4 family)
LSDVGLQTKHLLMAAIVLEGLGGLLFTLGSSLGAYLLLIFLAAVTPIMHDFYNFDLASPDYLYQFNSFLKVNLGACLSSAFHFLNSVGTLSKITTFK